MEGEGGGGVEREREIAGLSISCRLVFTNSA